MRNKISSFFLEQKVTVNNSYKNINNLELEYENYDYIDKLEYNKKTKRINLIIKNFEKKAKITRYVQSNYVRTPIYGDYSIKRKNIKTIDKRININRFLEEELPTYSFDEKIYIEIIDYLGYIPSWRKKELDISAKKKAIKAINKSIYNNNEKIATLKKDILFIQKKHDKEVKDSHDIQTIKSTPDSTFRKIAYILLSFSILGTISWSFYTSKAKAEKNKIIKENNIKNLKESVKNKELKIFKINEDIKNHSKANDEYFSKITLNKQELSAIRLKEYKMPDLRETDEGFLSLKNSFNYNWNNQIKGIYIIWNKTKNKHYVGQSKNIMKRVMTQHFNNGEVKNIIFAKDWFGNDDFYWKYIECRTKDEMDMMEKNYIEEYNSFFQGYNSNSGNT